MKEINKMIKKVLIVFLVSIQVLFLVACGGENQNYPMSAFDKDLKVSTRESIKKAFEDKQFEKIEEKNKNINSSTVEEGETFYNDTSNNAAIDDDYAEYERDLYQNKNSIYSVNLSITTIDSGYKYKVLNKGVPDFTIKEYDGKAFEEYSELDSLGRCGKAVALLGVETMPAEGEVRGSIGVIKPSGWQTPQSKYDFIDGKFLYNRCHLIGWQLSAENSNEKNLITGTRYLNTKGMLPYENQVANYIKSTHNHVLYRVTPIFEGQNLVASRVQIEALSFEDNGAGLKFNVLLENYEPGVHIDYATGKNWEENKTTDKNNEKKMH